MSTFRSLLILIFIGFSASSASAQFKGSDKLTHKLLQAVEQRNQSRYHVHVMLYDQVDLEAWEKYFTHNKTPYNKRSPLLLKALKEKAKASQPELLDFLQNFPSVDKTSIRPHWITNAISFDGDDEVIRLLAARNDVQWIGENVVLQATSVEKIASSQMAPDDVEDGLKAINAPAMWALGYTGYGTKLFTADTGVDPNHPAIKHQYHGNFVPEAQAWYPNPFAPNQQGRGAFDCSNHGTHVTGTVLGLDRENRDTIGVAFNANWMGGAILCGVGTADNIGAFEWAVDPDGDDNTTDDMPDVINNSWYDPSLDEKDCNSIYVPILQTLELVGVAVVFSAGNEGPDPMTITQPHNININEVNSFTVGALNGNTPALPIASFSSRGPSHCEGEGSLKIKPEVSAPGVSVRSCVPGNGYDLLSGTSMAAPHVSGSVLLLKEAFPYLGGKDIKLALYNSCTDLGDEGEDNVFGMGIINVYAAYEYLIAQGHVPVNPKVAHDAIVLNVHHASMGCNEEVNPFIQVENAGTDTILSMVITYGADTIVSQYVWEGILGTGERTYIQLPGFELPSGFTVVSVSVDSINGSSDAKPLNNKKILPLSVTDRENLAVEYEWAQNICAKSSIVLTSPLGAHGDHETNWYTEPFGGEPRYSGNMVVIGTDSLEKELFAEVKYLGKVGEGSPDAASSFYETAKNNGLVFDALAEINLVSFDIYSEKRHDVEVVLLNEKGETVFAVTKPQTAAGLRTITVNWTIPPGENYRLIKKIGRGMLSQKDNVHYPYSIRNIININSAIKNDTLVDEYVAFYNLNVSYVEPCGRLAYTFDIRQDTSLVKPEFTVSRDTLVLPDDNILTGQSLVTEMANVSWDMGDGNIYQSNTVEHAYQNPGTYQLCFHVVDTSLCFTAGVKDIVVLEASSANDVEAKAENLIGYYPNPASTILTLVRENKADITPLSLNLFDATGAIKNKFSWYNNPTFEILLESYPKGIYWLTISGKNTAQVVKFVKL